jgi:hypothetical protein
MALPYVPGWWDEINKNGAITNLAQQLPAIIQPDRVAGKRLEAMIQQNPELITQISNMDPTARQAMAGALGFKNYDRSGLGNIEEGQQLQDRNAMRTFLKTATPRQQEQRVARLAGVEDSTTIDQKDKSFSLGVQKTEQDIRVGKQDEELKAIELKEKGDLQVLADSLKVKYPAESFNLEESALRFIKGDLSTPELQRITTDPTLSGAFKTWIEAYQERIRLQAQKDIASLRNPQEKLLGIQFLQQGVDNALQQINAAETQIKNMGNIPAMGIFIKPEVRQQYESLLASRDAAKSRHTQLTAAFNSALKTEFGGKYPEVFDPSKIGLGSAKFDRAGPVDPRIQGAVNDIRSGTASLQALELSPAFTPEEKTAIRSLLSKGGK